MIGLIDYGMGNLHSVSKALESVGGRVHPVRQPDDLKSVSHIVLPGVGAFRDCIGTLKERGLDEALIEKIRQGVPYLGICLGMQVLMDASLEFGRHEGLGLISGLVKPFPETHPERGYKIPHMGWNDVVFAAGTGSHSALDSLAGRQTYFVHSFVCVPNHSEEILASTDYGDHSFASMIGRDNMVGVQFHPEKSQAAGLALLRAFLGLRQ